MSFTAWNMHERSIRLCLNILFISRPEEEPCQMMSRSVWKPFLCRSLWDATSELAVGIEKHMQPFSFISSQPFIWKMFFLRSHVVWCHCVSMSLPVWLLQTSSFFQNLQVYLLIHMKNHKNLKIWQMINRY